MIYSTLLTCDQSSRCRTTSSVVVTSSMLIEDCCMRFSDDCVRVRIGMSTCNDILLLPRDVKSNTNKVHRSRCRMLPILIPKHFARTRVDDGIIQLARINPIELKRFLTDLNAINSLSAPIECTKAFESPFIPKAKCKCDTQKRRWRCLRSFASRHN
ncbi:unnamed protein product [Albugo candida]|uniref:Uncharacterized protein n=1 Tax=Albugo candida TaxID=65357 RepID=A0A024FVB1_9STRA|nr:unnamed protein product [Albugo candida]|eukprot:CCI10589.1 unnamed protein product [Albugo candida]